MTGKYSVLIVDDESDFLRTFSKRLARRQVDAATADSGEEALAFLEATPVDVVVMDVRMPGMDGLAVLKEIKRRWPGIEVIMLSGHADGETAMQGMTLGAFDYLLKPTDTDEMVYRIEGACAGKRILEEQLKKKTGRE